MSDLADFLLARIAEDQDQADQDAAVSAGFLNGKSSRSQLECEAKRRLIELGAKDADWTDVLELLALPYSDHPDFREEWRV